MTYVPTITLVVGLLMLLASPFGWRSEAQIASLQLASAPLPQQMSETVVFVNIDEASLDAHGAWPWPRTRIARLVDAVSATEAAGILLVLPLEDADAAAPQRAVEAWDDRSASSLLSSLPNTDEVLTRTLNETGTTLALFDGGSPAPAFDDLLLDREVAQGFLNKLDVHSGGPVASNVSSLVALGLRRDWAGRPAGAFLVGASGETRAAGAALYPLLGTAETIRIRSNGAPGGIPFVDPVGLAALEIDDARIPLLSDGSIIFRRDIAYPMYSASQILSGESQSSLADRFVVIGSVLPQASGNTALAPGLAPAQAITQAIAQVSAGATPARAFVLTWIEVLLTLVIGAAVLYMTHLGRPWFAFALAIAAGIAAWGASVYLLQSQNVLLDSVALMLILSVVGAVALLGGEASAGSTKQRFAHAVQDKLPFGAPAHLSRNPRKLLEQSDSRKMTVLCCAIRGFEELQDLYKDDPQGMTTIVNQFHDMVGEHVRSLGGTIDRYGGAQILAFWNAPVDEPDHAIRACDCALRLVDSLENLNQSIEAQAYRTGKAFSPIHLGIGINTGRATVGNVGSRRRPAYSAIGEAVTVAQRLLANSSNYGPAIIVGEHTYQAVKNRFALLEIDKITIPSRSYAIRVFALLGNPVTKASPRFRALEDAHTAIFEAYRDQNWSLAEALINECRKLNGAIPALYDLYEHRIDFYRRYPPGPEWDGAFSVPVV